MVGKPHYTEEQIEAAKELYLQLLAQGKTEVEIDVVDGLPGHTYRSKWKDQPTFAEQCLRARAIGAEYSLLHAETALDHVWAKADDDAANPQLVQVAVEKMKHARWKAAKFNSDYSEKKHIENRYVDKEGNDIIPANADKSMLERYGIGIRSDALSDT